MFDEKSQSSGEVPQTPPPVAPSSQPPVAPPQQPPVAPSAQPSDAPQPYRPSYTSPATPAEDGTEIKHSKAGLVVGIILVLLLAGGGAFAYVSGVFTGKSPEMVMNSMLDAMQDVESAEATVTFELHSDLKPLIEAHNASIAEAKLENDKMMAEYEQELVAYEAALANGEIQEFDEYGFSNRPFEPFRFGEEPHPLEELGLDRIDLKIVSQSQGNYELGDAARQQGVLSLDSQLLAAKLSHKRVGNQMYLQLSDIAFGDVTSFPVAMFTPFVELITEQWILIDTEEIFSLDFMQMLNEKKMQAKDEQNELYPELKAAFLKHRPITFTEVKSKEKSLYIYDLEVNPEQLEAFMNELSSITGDAEIQSQFRNEQMRKDLEEFKDVMEDLSLQMAVNKKTYLPAWFSMHGTIHPPADDASSELIPGLSNVSIEVGLRVDFDKYNEPFDVQAPENAKTFEEMVQAVMGGFMGGALMSDAMMMGDDQFMMEADGMVSDSLDSDFDTIPDDFELLFGTDKNNADTDGDGFDDATEILNGFNPTSTGDDPLENAEMYKQMLLDLY